MGGEKKPTQESINPDELQAISEEKLPASASTQNFDKDHSFLIHTSFFENPSPDMKIEERSAYDIINEHIPEMANMNPNAAAVAEFTKHVDLLNKLLSKQRIIQELIKDGVAEVCQIRENIVALSLHVRSDKSIESCKDSHPYVYKQYARNLRVLNNVITYFDKLIEWVIKRQEKRELAEEGVQKKRLEAYKR